MSETRQDSERKGNRLSKIVTRTGDAGTTGLGDGSRTTKDSLRIDAIGEVDELNSSLGVLLCEDLPDNVRTALLDIQNDLFDLGGELCLPGMEVIKDVQVARLEELVEAARIDGAGPMRFFKDILVPLSQTSIAALFVIQFIYGWNQYLWPLLATTSEDMYPVVIGIKRMIASGDAAVDWNLVMATAVLALVPPGIVVVLMQRWFVKGLVDTEK